MMPKDGRENLSDNRDVLPSVRSVKTRTRIRKVFRTARSTGRCDVSVHRIRTVFQSRRGRTFASLIAQVSTPPAAHSSFLAAVLGLSSQAVSFIKTVLSSFFSSSECRCRPNKAKIRGSSETCYEIQLKEYCTAC